MEKGQLKLLAGIFIGIVLVVALASTFLGINFSPKKNANTLNYCGWQRT